MSRAYPVRRGRRAGGGGAHLLNLPCDRRHLRRCEERTGESANESGKVHTKPMSSSYETSVKATVLTSNSVAESAIGHCSRAGLV